MALQLTPLLNRIIRFPWTVAPPGVPPASPVDRNVLFDLESGLGLPPYFRDAPKHPDVVQSIAAPVLFFWERCRKPYVEARNVWRQRIPAGSRAEIAELYGFSADNWYMMTMARDLADLETWVCLATATFAFTTHTEPRVVSMVELGNLFYDPFHQDTKEYAELLLCGMLVIQKPSDPAPWVIKNTAALSALLWERASRHRLLTVFADVATGDCLDVIQAGEIPSSTHIITMFRDTDFGKSTMRHHLQGKVLFRHVAGICCQSSGLEVAV